MDGRDRIRVPGTLLQVKHSWHVPVLGSLKVLCLKGGIRVGNTYGKGRIIIYETTPAFSPWSVNDSFCDFTLP